MADWSNRGPIRKSARLAGDALVLIAAGMGLGTVAGIDGALEAVVAVVLLAGVTSLGPGAARLAGLPGFRALVRWTRRLRTFYRRNEPGSPASLLARPVIGVFGAPFRSVDRTEVRLYLELGAGFAAFFLLLDVVPEAVVPLVAGSRPLELDVLLEAWLAEAITTFALVYVLAAPVGGVLTLRVLVHRTRTVPRLLAVLTLLSIGAGLVT